MLYRNLSGYLREKYGKRLGKICIDGGFSCPNRDGKCGHGGCIYCGERGAGEHIDPSASIREQVLTALREAEDEDLFIATMGGEPCYNVKKIVQQVFDGKDLCFVGYTDACAYIVDDVMIEEGGYEPTSSLEYGLKGNFKPGISQKLREGFENALKQSLQ